MGIVIYEDDILNQFQFTFLFVFGQHTGFTQAFMLAEQL